MGILHVKKRMAKKFGLTFECIGKQEKDEGEDGFSFHPKICVA